MPDKRGHRFIRTGGRFPLRGKTRRAKRNRAIVAGAGIGALGVGGVLLTGSGRYMGPVRSLTGLTGGRTVTYENRPSAVVYHSDRPADHWEAGLAGALARHGGHAGKRLLLRLGVRPSADQPGGWEVSGAPLAARAHVHYVKRRLPQKIEQGSLWNVAGKGRLLHGIQTASLYAQAHARRLAAKPVKAVGDVGERVVARGVGTATKYLHRKSHRLAGRVVLLGRHLAHRSEARRLRKGWQRAIG